MSIADGFVMELEQEAATTRRVLERLPEDKLSWKPHPKSMSLGQLALHVAQIPDVMSQLLSTDVDGMPPSNGQAEASSRAELVERSERRCERRHGAAEGMERCPDDGAVDLLDRRTNGDECTARWHGAGADVQSPLSPSWAASGLSEAAGCAGAVGVRSHG